MEPLFDAIIKLSRRRTPRASDGFQVLVANLDYSDLPRAHRFRQNHGGQGESGRDGLLPDTVAARSNPGQKSR